MTRRSSHLLNSSTPSKTRTAAGELALSLNDWPFSRISNLVYTGGPIVAPQWGITGAGCAAFGPDWGDPISG
jgi:hypothetical protein